MKQNDLSQLSELLTQIERYFDCELSDCEEEQLRKAVARTRLSHPAIDEARALMGFRRAAPRREPQDRRQRFRLPAMATKVAASVAVIAALAVGARYVANRSSDGASLCVAYVNGERLTDEADVVRLLAASFDDLAQVEESMAEESSATLFDAAELIDDFESTPLFP